MLRSNLKRVKILQATLDRHRVPGKTHKYRRVICPGCNAEWVEPIYCEITACTSCQFYLRLYELYASKRIRCEDEEIRAGDEWEVEVAFHTGRLTHPMNGFPSDDGTRLSQRASGSYDEDECYDHCFGKDADPVFGWDHETGSEYGRPTKNWSEKWPAAINQRSA